MTNLIPSIDQSLVQRPDEQRMLAEIQERLPVVTTAIVDVGRSQSHMMDSCMTLDKLTPLRNARQCLHEINKSLQAMAEAGCGIEEKQIQVEIYERDADSAGDPLQARLLRAKARTLRSEIDRTMPYYLGAVRRVRTYMEHYDALLRAAGKTTFSEADLEADEARYHVMTAFRQALNHARTNGGAIDPGNMIYMSQIGINGRMAQEHVSRYLADEDAALSHARAQDRDVELTYGSEMQFLGQMANRYAAAPRAKAQLMGLPDTSVQQALTGGGACADS